MCLIIFCHNSSLTVSLLRVVVFFNQQLMDQRRPFQCSLPWTRWKTLEGGRDLILRGVVPAARKCNKEQGVCDGEGLPFKMGGMRGVLLTSRLETRCRLGGRMMFDVLTHSLRVFVWTQREVPSLCASCELLKQIRWFYDQRWKPCIELNKPIVVQSSVQATCGEAVTRRICVWIREQALNPCWQEIRASNHPAEK